MSAVADVLPRPFFVLWGPEAGAQTVAGRISSLEVQRKNPQRVNVFVEGTFALGLALIEAAKLSKGQFLSDADIADLRQRDDRERAYELALNYLSYRPRSEGEVRKRLRQKGYPEQAVEEAMDRLRRAGLVDDEAFARYWIANRDQFKPRGRYALRQELRQKGVPDRVVGELLEDVNEDDNAYQAAIQRLSRWQGLALDEQRRKLSGYLQRRGFRYETIREVWERLLAEELVHEPDMRDGEDRPTWDQET